MDIVYEMIGPDKLMKYVLPLPLSVLEHSNQYIIINIY